MPIKSSMLILFLATSSQSQDEVVITFFPSSGFLIRNEPFLLSCTVINAKSIRFRCNGEWMDESRQLSMEGVNKDGTLYLQSSINISKSEDDIEKRCDCYGIGKGEITVKSERQAVISPAYMKKHFEHNPPSSIRIKEGSQFALPCLPPLSHPVPIIEWTRNGQVISLDNYRIMGSDGSLLFSSIRLQDGGTYVCTATNVAASRSTPPSSIYVYVDGGWSEWTEWNGQCSVQCHQLDRMIKLRGHQVIPTLSRRRWCNNPAPLNGGLPCTGDDEESSLCPLLCSIDGGWSEWGKWSLCSSQCTTNRTRTCSNPYPLNGGNHCIGDSDDSISCSTGICSSRWYVSDGIVVVSLFAVPILLSILLSLCILLLCRQKSIRTHSYCGDIASYKSGIIVEGAPFMHSPLPSMTMMTNKNGYARYESGGGYSISRGGESRQALLDGCSTTSSARKAFLTTNSSVTQEDTYATVYECVRGDIYEGEGVLPARVDREGGRLSIHNNGTHLLIGEESLESPTTIILSTHSPDDDLPMKDEYEIPVSCAISTNCSSQSCIPRFPFILSFTHCMQSIDEWNIYLYSNTNYGWDRYEIESDSNDSTSPIFTHFDSHNSSVIHCAIPHYGKFLLCARPKKLNPMLRMRVAVFTQIDRRDTFSLRVNIVRDGSGKTDRQENERLIIESIMLVVMDGGPLCICLEDMAPSFSSTHNYMEMDLSTQSSYSFEIESIDTERTFNARLVLLQKGSFFSNPLILSVSLDHNYDELVTTEESQVSLDFRLPYAVKERIVSLLDPPSERDWMSLARCLGISSFVHFGRTLSSPTTVLLTLWEARREDPCHLAHALRLSGRPQIAHIVDNIR